MAEILYPSSQLTSNTTVSRGLMPPGGRSSALRKKSPGTCVGDGTITFDHFIAEVTAAQKAGAWHYDPTEQTVEPGTALTLENRGGETHTFTKVAKYGGGFVAPLNALSGNPVPAPECAIVTMGGLIPKPPSDSNLFLEAGETEDGPIAGSAVLPSGTITKFQCCIHPWMRLEVTK